MKLTKSEQEVLDFIWVCLVENTMPPTVREIGAHFGWTSPTWPSQVLRRLHRKGQIKFNPKLSRGINICDERSMLMRKFATIPMEDLRRIVKENGL